MGDSDSSPEDQVENRNMASKCEFQAVSAGNKNSVGSWTREYVSSIVAENCLHFVHDLMLCIRLRIMAWE